MTEITLEQYGPIISDKVIGNEIYDKISNHLANDKVSVDFASIKSMATFNAKQIFGKLYLELGPELFFEKVIMLNASRDIKTIIKMGIQSAIDEKKGSNQQ